MIGPGSDKNPGHLLSLVWGLILLAWLVAKYTFNIKEFRLRISRIKTKCLIQNLKMFLLWVRWGDEWSEGGLRCCLRYTFWRPWLYIEVGCGMKYSGVWVVSVWDGWWLEQTDNQTWWNYILLSNKESPTWDICNICYSERNFVVPCR